MTKYMVIYHADSTVMEQVQSRSPDEVQHEMQAWMTWADMCGSSMVEMGAPLGDGTALTLGSVEPSSRQVCGYSVLQADTKEDVIGLLEDHPHFGIGGECSIEVHQMIEMSGK